MNNIDSESARSLNQFLTSLQRVYPTAEQQTLPTCPEVIISFFQSLTKDYSCSKAKLLSKQERNTQHLTSNSFSYGEIPFQSLSLIFAILKSKHNYLSKEGGIFYDLGSGLGKGVIGASLMHCFDKCIGIEYLESLHQSSLELLQEFDRQKIFIQDEVDTIPQITFIKGDIAQIDWSDGTFIYASSTCYDPKLMECMNIQALLLKKGSFFITLTKILKPESEWQIIDSFKVETSWGTATLYIQIKKYDPTLSDNDQQTQFQ